MIAGNAQRVGWQTVFCVVRKIQINQSFRVNRASKYRISEQILMILIMSRLFNFHPYRFSFTIICLMLYIYLSLVVLEKLRNDSERNVLQHFGDTTLMVVAHPDDELMFFGPTIKNLLRYDKSLVILCLTHGGVDHKRAQELFQVAKALGPRVSVKMIHNPMLPDDITIKWKTTEVVDHLRKHILESSLPIKTVITFDSYGVSGHPNHQAIHSAAKCLTNDLTMPNFLALKSLSLLRKYTSFVDSVYTYLCNNYLSTQANSTIILSVDLIEYSSLKSLLQLHESQMVWFRKLYMTFSRYMFINDLEYFPKNPTLNDPRCL